MGRKRIRGSAFARSRKRLVPPMTQRQVADEIGATQSQISDFENNTGNVLSASKIEAYAKLLGSDFQEYLAGHADQRDALAFCNSTLCPSHEALANGKRIYIVPDIFHTKDTFCRCCGEPLYRTCIECLSPVKPGRNCAECGAFYVDPPSEEELAGQDPMAWAAQQQRIHLAVLGSIQTREEVQS